jgi:hypothetical protein
MLAMPSLECPPEELHGQRGVMSLSKPFGRAHLVLAVVIALSLAGGWSGEAEAEDAPPASITLLAPGSRSTVTLKPRQNLTFRWDVKWPVAPTEKFMFTFQLATDPGFTRIGTTENHSCTPEQGASCWTSFTPSRVYEPYGQTWYWRVSIRGGSTSATGSFKVRLLRDTVRPRVRALTTTIFRGRIALFAARMADDRGELRFRATLSRGGRTVVAGSYPFTAMGWDRPFVFESEKPISRSLPAGKYSFCVQVWDHSGNTARHCAVSNVR